MAAYRSQVTSGEWLACPPKEGELEVGFEGLEFWNPRKVERYVKGLGALR